MIWRTLLLFSILNKLVVYVLGQQSLQQMYQPHVHVVQKGKAMTFIGFPDGSPWCEGRPTYMWIVHNNTRPYCLGEDGEWRSNRNHGVRNFRDLHPCVPIDINRDGVLDLACVVGAARGTGEGHNKFYLTDPNTGILGDELEGPNDLQIYPTMRTRFFIKVRAADGGELVMITTHHGEREDGKPNQHRLFRHNGPFRFDEVSGPWIQNTTYDCVVAGDLNDDGIEDVVVCDRDQQGWMHIQNQDLSWRGISLQSLGDGEKFWRDARTADVTGDGLADLITVGPSYPWRGSRQGMQPHIRIFQGDPSLPFLFDFDNPYFEHYFSYGEARAVEVIDSNGDGLLDVYVLLNDASLVNETRCRSTPDAERSLWPPIDTAPDVLFLATEDRNPEPFIPVEMEHELIGCEGHLAKWDNRTIAFAQGGFSREGANGLLRWPAAPPTAPPFTEVPRESHRWRFNDDVADIIGGANGSLQGNATFTNQAVEGGKALSLPGGESQMVVSNEALMLPFDRFTVSLWFYANEVGGIRYLFEIGRGQNGLGIYLEESTIAAACVAGSGQVAELPGVMIQQRTWHHAVAVFDVGELRIYLDGERKGRAITPYSLIPFHADPTSIGGPGLQNGNSPHFVGIVDDARIWQGIVLNDAQIASLFSTQ